MKARHKVKDPESDDTRISDIRIIQAHMGIDVTPEWAEQEMKSLPYYMYVANKVAAQGILRATPIVKHRDSS